MFRWNLRSVRGWQVLRDAFWLGESMSVLRAGGESAMKINPRRPSSIRDGAAGALAHARDARDATKTAATAIGFQGPTEATLQAASAGVHSGPSDEERKCARLRTVDVTGSVRSHRVNQWLGSAEISLRVAAAVQAAGAERCSVSQHGGLVPTEQELQKARLSATDSICTPTKAAEELDESEEPVAPDWTTDERSDSQAGLKAVEGNAGGLGRDRSTE